MQGLYMKSAEIRQKFLEYFKSKGHTSVLSSSLIPVEDSSLLFTNSGMMQFKDVFLGIDKRNYTRATSVQCCLRAGGKHNDLDNVGYTARHHTFFEMLGNFSFGDYFKEDAISMAWEFLTEILGVDKERLLITVHKTDQEAEAIWLKQKGFNNRIIQCDDKDNFWSMGDTGPCGPCTEIFYDHDPDGTKGIQGGEPGSENADGDRFIEIWNLVFMQYNQNKDGSRVLLPRPSVDTGMGLERISAVMQGVHNNYDTDLFVPLIEFAINLHKQGHSDTYKWINFQKARFNIMADHIRSACFLIKDGIVPSNEERGYVLRRIIRRALRHGYQFDMPKYFFAQLVAPLVEIMGDAYPDLIKAKTNIENVLKREEDVFMLTLAQAMKILEEFFSSNEASGGERVLPGNLIFKLFDTYGLPYDLTADVARERGHEIGLVGYEMDQAGYEKCMQAQRERSRSGGKFDTDYNAKEKLIAQLAGMKSEFEDSLNKTTMFLVIEDSSIETIAKTFKKACTSIMDALPVLENEHAILVLEKTPFYAEGGGQVGDTGEIVGKNFIFRVENTVREGKAILHYGYVSQGQIDHLSGTEALAKIDIDRRKATMRHHSATHLLHEALQKILGNHVQQKGSLVAPDRLRFDFSHFEPITKEQLRKIEELVNIEVVKNDEVRAKEMAIDEAKSAGAMALFGEKYGDVVRTIKMGTSFELCGGTHVSRTGDIGAFKIISEGSIASGIRRIEAIAGPLAWEAIYHEQNEAEQQKNFAAIKQKELEKTIEQLKIKLAAQQAMSLLSQVKAIDSINLLVAHAGEVDAKALSSMVESLKPKLNHAVIVLASTNNDAACLVVGVSAELHAKIKAGDLVKHLAPVIDGKGGGRPDIAQAGGKLPGRINEMLALAESWVKEKLK